MVVAEVAVVVVIFRRLIVLSLMQRVSMQGNAR